MIRYLYNSCDALVEEDQWHHHTDYFFCKPSKEPAKSISKQSIGEQSISE